MRRQTACSTAIWMLALSCLVSGSVHAQQISDLESGMRIKAKGDFGSRGELVAREVSVRDAEDRDFELAGKVTAVDTKTIAFRIHEWWVIPDPGELSRRDQRVIAQLVPGDFVKVEGEWSRNGQLIAEEFERLRRGRKTTSVEGIIDKVGRKGASSGVLELGVVRVRIRKATEIEVAASPASGGAR